jgi:5-methylcytosine-specific restriction endonuclease McrA
MAKRSLGLHARRTQERNAQLRRDRLQAARSRGTHTEYEWMLLVVACDGSCVKCRAFERMHKDHILPIVHGGSDAINNLQPLCRRCNLGKRGDTTDHRPAAVRRALGVA